MKLENRCSKEDREILDFEIRILNCLRFFRALIEIEIINDDEYEKSEDFYVELSSPSWLTDYGLGQNGADGRPVLGSHTRCRIDIVEDIEFKVRIVLNWITLTSILVSEFRGSIGRQCKCFADGWNTFVETKIPGRLQSRGSR